MAWFVSRRNCPSFLTANTVDPRWPAGQRGIGLGEPVLTTKTLRRRFLSLAGRLTRKARRLTLHLPQGWPWQNQFSNALARPARPATSFLTPPTGSDPSPRLLKRLADPRQALL